MTDPCSHTSTAKAPEASSDAEYSVYLFLPDESHRIANMVDAITAALEYLYSIIPKTGQAAAGGMIGLPKFKINLN